MKWKFRGVTAALLCAVLLVQGCGGGGDPTPAIPSSRTLPVPLVQQQTQVWCWAAAEQMVLAAFGRPFAQADIVTATYGAPVLQPGTAGQIQQGIFFFSGGTLAPQVIPGALSFEQVRVLIASGRPIVVQYESPFLTEGHFVVIFGYTANGEVLINDPIFGQFTVPYGSSFVYGAPTGPLVWFLSIV